MIIMLKKTLLAFYRMIIRKAVASNKFILGFLKIRINNKWRCVFHFFSLLFIVFLNIAVGNIALCSIIYPQRYTQDGRFKTFNYRQYAIYYLVCHYTQPIMLSFAPNEKVNTISIPKSHLWETKLLQNGNVLSLMPKESGNDIGNQADSHMTVITNFRTYHFELHAKMPTGPFDPDISYSIKFNYPNSVLEKKHSSDGDDGSIIRYSLEKGPDLSQPENFNFNYTVSTIGGGYMIVPIKVFDDGQFTYFEFKDKNGINPAIFSVDSNGLESIVNFRIINEYIAVEGVNAVYTLRYGNATACVFNETMRGIMNR